MEDKVTRRDFGKLVARGALLAFLGYCISRAARGTQSGEDNGRCRFPDIDCRDCSLSGRCRIRPDKSDDEQ